MRATELRLYKLVLDDSRCPIDDWVTNLRDTMTRARVLRQIDKMARGNLGQHRFFDGIGELKLDLGPGYRVYFALQGNVVVLLLGGCDKKSQSAYCARSEAFCGLEKSRQQSGAIAGLGRPRDSRGRGTKPMKATPFEETLFRELRDPEFASAYLQDALDDSPEEFFVALRKYVQANNGMGQMAKSADVTREALYRMLSENGNPAFKSVESILRASGLRMRFDVQDREEEMPLVAIRELVAA